MNEAESLALNDNPKPYRELLRSDDIEVSYFAAGIAAHLSSFSPIPWTVETITKEQLIQDLVKPSSSLVHTSL